MINVKKALGLSSSVLYILLAALILFSASGLYSAAVSAETEQWEPVVGDFFELRNTCVLSGDLDTLKASFLTSEKSGLWAYENEKNRSKALGKWFEKQNATLLGIESSFAIRRIKKVGRGYSFYVVSSDEYSYAYDDDLDTVNVFRIGTCHSLDMIPGEGENAWVVSREWYSDPFSQVPDAEFAVEISEYISSMAPPDLSSIGERRKKAVEYADRYCGAASTAEYGYSYNKNYTDYNPQGGDCANFASQVLFEGGGFRKTTSWNYANGKGNYNWLKAGGLKRFLLYSGRASQIAAGSYASVYKAAYKLLPGDIIAYAEDGKITHVSVVTGVDSKGYPLVNCHNVDRYRVPWDIGWNKTDVKFYLLRVHY